MTGAITFEDDVKPVMAKTENPYTAIIKEIAGATVDGKPRTKKFTTTHETATKNGADKDIARIRRQLTDAAKAVNVTARTKFATSADHTTTTVWFWTVAKIARKGKAATPAVATVTTGKKK